MTETMRTYTRLVLAESEMPLSDIEKARLFNVFVFSLPRSGSSMMSNIVQELGVNMIHTSDTPEELEKRNENERKRYGDEYKMNEGGFFEITKNVWHHYLRIMATPFSGCKMILPITPERMSVVEFNPCAKVVMMWRDPEEMRQSQQASYNGDKGVTEDEAEAARAVIRTKLVNQKLALEKKGIDTIHIQYQAVLADPEKAVRDVAAFLRVEDEEKILAAIKVVQPEKNRFKKDELVESI